MTPTAPPGNAPVNLTPPTISGTPATGQVLSCNPGAWTGDPTITYVAVWQRDGESIAGGWTYTLVAADAGTQVRCLVVATNPAGKGAARSAPVGGNACGGATGVDINGGAGETTSPLVQLTIRRPAGATIRSPTTRTSLTPSTLTPSADCTYAWTMNSIPGLAAELGGLRALQRRRGDRRTATRSWCVSRRSHARR